MLNRLLKGSAAENETETEFIEQEAAKYYDAASEAADDDNNWGKDSTSKIPSDRTKQNDDSHNLLEDDATTCLRDMFEEKRDQKRQHVVLVECNRCGYHHEEAFTCEMRCSSSRDGMIFKDTCVRFALVRFYKNLDEKKQDKSPEERTEQIMERLMENRMTLDNLLDAIKRKYGVTLLDVKKNRSSSFASMGIEFKSGTQMFHAADDDGDDGDDGDDDDDDDDDDDGNDDDDEVVEVKEAIQKTKDGHCDSKKEKIRETTTTTTKSRTQHGGNVLSQNENTSETENKMIDMFGDHALRLIGLDKLEVTNITMEEIAALRRSVPKHELKRFVNEVNRAFPSLGVILP